MIDTHCHLLHGVDDGPRNPLESFLLARELAVAGVTSVVCTPHWSRRFNPTREALESSVAQVRTAIGEAGLELEVALAAEVSARLALDAPRTELAERALRCHIFVELEPGTTLPTLTSVSDRLESIGLKTVLVHPERCRAVQREPAALDRLRDDGALVQVVARSFEMFAGVVSATAWKLIDTGRADLLGSDAHRPRQVAFFQSLLETIARRHGSGTAQGLVGGCADTILGYRREPSATEEPE